MISIAWLDDQKQFVAKGRLLLQLYPTHWMTFLSSYTPSISLHMFVTVNIYRWHWTVGLLLPSLHVDLKSVSTSGRERNVAKSCLTSHPRTHHRTECHRVECSSHAATSGRLATEFYNKLFHRWFVFVYLWGGSKLQDSMLAWNSTVTCIHLPAHPPPLIHTRTHARKRTHTHTGMDVRTQGWREHTRVAERPISSLNQLTT